jgi:hypothetical protein
MDNMETGGELEPVVNNKSKSRRHGGKRPSSTTPAVSVLTEANLVFVRYICDAASEYQVEDALYEMTCDQLAAVREIALNVCKVRDYEWISQFIEHEKKARNNVLGRRSAVPKPPTLRAATKFVNNLLHQKANRASLLKFSRLVKYMLGLGCALRSFRQRRRLQRVRRPVPAYLKHRRQHQRQRSILDKMAPSDTESDLDEGSASDNGNNEANGDGEEVEEEEDEGDEEEEALLAPRQGKHQQPQSKKKRKRKEVRKEDKKRQRSFVEFSSQGEFGADSQHGDE